jgi:hypothetical protein
MESLFFINNKKRMAPRVFVTPLSPIQKTTPAGAMALWLSCVTSALRAVLTREKKVTCLEPNVEFEGSSFFL